MPRKLTFEEKAAITALETLAETWPQTLQLFSASGSLIVIPNDQSVWIGGGAAGERLQQDAPVAHIDGIPNDGGDPW